MRAAYMRAAYMLQQAQQLSLCAHIKPTQPFPAVPVVAITPNLSYIHSTSNLTPRLA